MTKFLSPMRAGVMPALLINVSRETYEVIL
nr:MAG TPA: hypothetical protein [Caudoviricetes sp.]